MAQPSTEANTVSLWTEFKSGLLTAAGVCIPGPRGKPKEGVTPGTVAIIDESRRARLNGMTGRYRELRREAIRAMRRDAEDRVRAICEEVEGTLFAGDPRPAYRALRQLRSSGSSPRTAAVRAANGDILTEESDVKSRWSEYFEELLNAEPPSRELETENVDPVVADPPLCCDPPSLDEVRKAVEQLKNGKAPGVCGIHAEMLKSGGETTLKWLHILMCSVWSTGVIPTDWKMGHIVPIWKGKGDTRDCNNYRGVTLLSVPGKVFARILLNRVRQQLLAHQRPEQSGFTPKRSTVDRILALRLLIERRREFDRGLLAAYIDFKKAFDSVSRESLWRILELRGIPPTLVNLIASLYSETASAVKCGTTVSDPFPVETGVRQGCVLAPSLFSTCMDWIMGKVVESTGCGASFGEVEITDLDFADDAVIFAEAVDVLSEALETLSEEAEPLGLRVSWIKTKIQAFGDLMDAAVGSVPVRGENVEVVDKFTYLGSVIHSSSECGADVDRRLGLAWGTMNSLNKTVWRSRYLSIRTKVRVLRSLVLPVLLYGCETWTLKDGLSSRLDSFLTQSLRRIFGYRWFDKVSNRAVLKRAGMGAVTCLIRERQLRFFGHVARFPEGDPAYRILSAKDPVGWVRHRGGQYASWIRQQRTHLGDRMGQAQALSIARRKPREWSRVSVSAAKCRCGACPPT